MTVSPALQFSSHVTVAVALKGLPSQEGLPMIEKPIASEEETHAATKTTKSEMDFIVAN